MQKTRPSSDPYRLYDAHPVLNKPWGKGRHLLPCLVSQHWNKTHQHAFLGLSLLSRKPSFSPAVTFLLGFPEMSGSEDFLEHMVFCIESQEDRQLSLVGPSLHAWSDRMELERSQPKHVLGLWGWECDRGPMQTSGSQGGQSPSRWLSVVPVPPVYTYSSFFDLLQKPQQHLRNLLGQWDDTAHEDICHQDWQPELHSLDPHGSRELPPTSCPLIHVHIPPTWVHTRNKEIDIIQVLNMEECPQ